MTRQMRTAIFVAAVMIAASVSAVALRPTEKIADRGPKVDLEAMIPRQFGDWHVDDSIVPLLPAPDLQARLDKIYNQTLARTYIDGAGRRIMLSIAYGGDQSDAMQVHRPEVCYAAQGFQVTRALPGEVGTEFGVLPVKRVVAVAGSRNEPITYWIVVGEMITHGPFGHKFAQLRYGLSGKVPDGVLVRVSNIDRDAARSYSLQEKFIDSMLQSMNEEHRRRVVGRANGINQR